MSCTSTRSQPAAAQETASLTKQEKLQAALQRLESTAYENRNFCGTNASSRSMPEVEQGACTAKILDVCWEKCSALQGDEKGGCINECFSNLVPSDSSAISTYKENARKYYSKAYE